jgi:hypothetical protein
MHSAKKMCLANIKSAIDEEAILKVIFYVCTNLSVASLCCHIKRLSGVCSGVIDG